MWIDDYVCMKKLMMFTIYNHEKGQTFLSNIYPKKLQSSTINEGAILDFRLRR